MLKYIRLVSNIIVVRRNTSVVKPVSAEEAKQRRISDQERLLKSLSEERQRLLNAIK